MKDKAQYQADYDDSVTLNSLIKALGLLVESRELLDTADMHNANDDWMGEIPTISSDVQETAYNLKKLLGVPLNPEDIELFIDLPAKIKAERAETSTNQSKDENKVITPINGNEPAEKTTPPTETLNDTYDIVELAYNVLRAGNKGDDYGVQEAVKELNTTTMNYFADIANQ